MATIGIDVSDAALALANKHATELGYVDASDWAFELLRNFVATREDSLYVRMPTGEQNPVFGRSKREQFDFDKRAAVEAAEAAAAAAAAAASQESAAG